MYTIKKNSHGQNVVVKANNDGSVVSFFEESDNPESQAYLQWLAEGNTPEPADEQGGV